MTKEKTLIIIPARLKSTRLEKKLLIEVKGKTILEYTYNNAKKVRNSSVIVATDSKEIAAITESFGGKAVITPETLSSGTERVLYVVERLKGNYRSIVNLQADEPLLKAEYIERAVDLVEKHRYLISSLAFKNTNYEEFLDPNNVKVILDNDNYALYFSRAPIPYQTKDNFYFFFHHVGLYCYNPDFLHVFGRLKSYLEELERLEQLKILENGYRIKIALIDEKTVGIDTKDDLIKFNKILEE